MATILTPGANGRVSDNLAGIPSDEPISLARACRYRVLAPAAD